MHLAVLPQGIKSHTRCEVSQRLTRPSPVLVEVQDRLQHLLNVLQQSTPTPIMHLLYMSSKIETHALHAVHNRATRCAPDSDVKVGRVGADDLHSLPYILKATTLLHPLLLCLP